MFGQEIEPALHAGQHADASECPIEPVPNTLIPNGSYFAVDTKIGARQTVNRNRLGPRQVSTSQRVIIEVTVSEILQTRAQAISSIEDVAIVHPQEAAEQANLIYVNDEEPGITRRRSGKGFSYRLPSGKLVSDPPTLGRIRKLAIPPAYTDVWICSEPRGHIQATGRDARGRKQYRYHARWREFRDSAKYERMLDFGRILPSIRERVDQDLARRGLPRERVLAAVVRLLETTFMRVGNDTYAKQNKSYGLTTLKDRHVEVGSTAMRFKFTGKSGKSWQLKLSDRRIAKVVKSCQDLPGQRLFQYLDAEGTQRQILSSDVNAYLHEITGRDFTAKDFRTWAGTLLAMTALREFEVFDSQAAAKRNLRAAIERVTARLGNTTTICRKCYIHPEIMNSYLEGSLIEQLQDQIHTQLSDYLERLTPEEAAVLAFLEARLRKDLAEARESKRNSK